MHRPIHMGKLIKESGLAALVMLGLTLTMIGFHISDISGGVALNYRLVDVAIVVVLTFIVRLCLLLEREGQPWPVTIVGFVGGALLLVGLIFGVTGDALPVYLPFQDIVVNWILALFLVVIAIRALFRMRQEREPAAVGSGAVNAKVKTISKFIGPFMLGLAILLPMTTYIGDPYFGWVDRRLLDIAVLVLTYVMLGWGLNIVVGLAGLLDLGYVAFYAVGAYSYALLSTYFDVSFWIALPFAGLMAASFGVLLGFPVLRLRGDYLAIVTLGFGEIIRVILLNWYEFTGGPDGISGIPRPSLFGLEFTRNSDSSFHEFFDLNYASVDRVVFLYYLILMLALLTNWFTLRIRKLPVGRAWEALREDEIACRSLGINPTNTKLTAFSIGAMFGGFSGSFFATRQGFISPESFTFIESAVILAIVVLGGMGSQIGVVIAAILLIGLPELFRELQQYRMLAFGGAMVLIMLWRPSGLLAFREPTIRLHKKGSGARAAQEAAI
ncbi:MAG: high-affinity branched-chain amino acid ABC transporter permease LivM [Magnetospiraceae bacterium]